MKKFLSTFIILLMSITINAQSLYCEINLKTINKQVHYTKCTPLYEEGGYVVIPNTMYKNNGSLGLLIYHHQFTDEYYAFDLKCPECDENDKISKVYMNTSILCKCPKCHSEFQNICLGVGQQTNLSGTHYLTTYNVYKRRNKLIITDDIIYEFEFDLQDFLKNSLYN